MQKFMITTLAAMMALVFGSALVFGQQTPAATTPAAPSTKTQTPAAKPKTTTGAKSHAPQAPLTLKTQKDKFSYALGMNLGKSLHAQSVPVDPNILARGLRDTLAGGKTALTEDEARAALMGRAERSQQETGGENPGDGRGKQEGGRGISCR